MVDITREIAGITSVKELAQAVYELVAVRGLCETGRKALESMRSNSYELKSELVIDNAFVVKLSDYLSVGLSMRDAAVLSGVTEDWLSDAVLNFAIPHETHVMLLDTLASYDALYKYKQLCAIQLSVAKNANWKAALSLLERTHPKQYGIKQSDTTQEDILKKLDTALNGVGGVI